MTMQNPKIFHDNRLADGTPVASSTASGYNVLNLRDFRPYTWWKPDAMPATVTVDSGKPMQADSVFLCGHDLGTQGTVVEVRGSDDNFAIALSGTAQAAASESLTLPAGASTVADYYAGMTVRINSGSGAIQERLVLGSKQNLFAYSEQFDNAYWTKVRLTPTATM